MIKACKKCRREGEKLLLKGERCLSQKCSVARRSYAPGQHGQASFRKISEYGRQLREKQKARRIYGVSELQFSNLVEKAEKMTGNSASNLLILLETRVDNIVYRLGYAESRSKARQMVSHGHFQVNGKKINTASITLRVGDNISPYKDKMVSDVKPAAVSWIDTDNKSGISAVKHLPSREEIETSINESLIIEFYSR